MVAILSQPQCEHCSVAQKSHYSDVIMSAMASPITSLAIVYSTVYSGADQRKHQRSASLAFLRGIHRWPVNSPHKGPVTRKCFHLMTSSCCQQTRSSYSVTIFYLFYGSSIIRDPYCQYGLTEIIIWIWNHVHSLYVIILRMNNYVSVFYGN